MPFTKLESTPDLLKAIGLPERLDEQHVYYYQLYRNNNGNAVFFCRSYSHGPENFTDMVLQIGEYSFSIKETTSAPIILETGKYKLTALTAYSEFPLKKYQRQKLREYLKEIIQIYSAERCWIEIDNKARLLIVDKTKSAKPRSISQLQVVLRKLTNLGKDYYLSPVMDFVIPALISEEESQLLRNHINKTDGKFLSCASLLFFELAYAKFQMRKAVHSSAT